MGEFDWITKVAFARFFFTGFETYSILPTAWYYIKSFDQTPFFLSLVLCAYNVGVVIASPLAGFMTDMSGNPRLIYILAGVLKVVANVMYSVSLSEYLPLFGRLLSGISDIGLSVLLGQIALQPEKKSRAGTFVTLEGTFCMGAVVGPGISSFLTFNVNILGWEINQGNSPGVILIVIWFVFLISSLLMPVDIWRETGRENLQWNGENHGENLSEFTGRQQKVSEHASQAKLSFIFMDSRISCLIFLTFCSEVFSSSTTFFTPILTLDHFHLHLIHAKLLFVNCALFTVVLFFSMYLASGYVEERKLCWIALFVQMIVIAFLTSLAYSWDHVSSVQHYILLLYACFGMPYLMFPLASSLLSKHADSRYATFVQSVSYAGLHLAIVVSRVSASFVLTKTSLLFYCLGLGVLWTISSIWYTMMYKKVAPNV